MEIMMIIKNKEVKDILIKCGWQENRTANISHYLDWYKKYNFKPSDEVIDFLSCFGELTLRIPSYRYMKRISSPKNNSDWELEVIVNPAFFITDDFSSEDIIESKQYAKDIGDFLGIENLIPVGSSSEYEEFFMGINGEFVYAYEGCCLCLGTTFEEALIRIMTDDNTDAKCIWTD